MLCLSRKVNQRIVIGNGLVTVTVTEIQPDQVKLGFEADPSVPIHREEVYLAIRRAVGRDSGKTGVDRE